MQGLWSVTCFIAACGRCCLMFGFMRNNVLLFCCKRTVVCWFVLSCRRKAIYCLVVAVEGCFAVWYLLQAQQRFLHCRILQKRNNFGQKQSAKKEKSIYIGKKTIQMSNFHNPAEIDINLTGREQILIQKSGCLFFWRKNSHYLRNNIFNRTSTVKLFEKTRIFLLKKILNETRNIAVPVFRKRKDLFFVRRNEKIAFLFIQKVFWGGKRHLFKRRQIGWHVNKISL